VALLCPIVYSCAAPEETSDYGTGATMHNFGGEGGDTGSESTSTESTMGGAAANVVTVTLGVSSTTDTSTTGATESSTTATTIGTVTTAVTTNAAATSGGGTGGMDECPDDPDKTAEGQCGCGVPDTDSDSDTTADCLDECPDDPEKTAPGTCGCGTPEDECGTLASSLVHRYSFDGTGTTVTDSVGNANGTLSGGTQSGGRVTLTGSGYVTLPAGLISGLGSVTLEVWYSWAGGEAWQRIFDFGISDAGAGAQGAGESYVFLTPQGVDAAGFLRAAFSPAQGPTNEVFIDAAATPSVGGTAYAAVVVVGGASISLYADGEFETSAPVSSPLSAIDDSSNWLGRSLFSADPGFNGSIDEFRIYDEAFGSTQVQASFSGGPDAN